jgi:type IV pilus assembly protein PilV
MFPFDDGTHMNAHPPARRHQARGITLIEVLVTMVLLGVGLLGLAGLQLRGMQVNQGSTFRSQAAILAEDLADRMRTDSATAAAHGYDASWKAGQPAPSTAATSAALLTTDWLYRLGSLPAGCAVVDTTTAAPATKITITWDDTRAVSAANPLVPVVAAAACTIGAGSGNGSYVLMTE